MRGGRSRPASVLASVISWFLVPPFFLSHMRSSIYFLGLLGLAAFSQLPPASAPARPAAPLPASAAKTDVLGAANAFLATLTAEQRQAVVVEFNASNAARWSNFPCGLGCRSGLLLQSLTAGQRAAALALVQAATGTVANDGFDEIQQLRAADNDLAAVRAANPNRGPGGPGGHPPGGRPGPPPGSRPPGGPPPGGAMDRPNGLGAGGYGSDLYAIAFLGTPSATGVWMLQFGGHHLATNITFGKGAVTGASPKFEGVEPLRFTTADDKVLPKGTACAPLGNEAAAMLALLGSLTPAQQAQAKLSQSFGDVLEGPGHDGEFPNTKVGVPGSALTPAQRQLLLAAMKPWVQDSDDATAARLLADYERQLAGTYVAFSGTGRFTQEGDYVCLDGPGVWIELVCQGAIEYRGQIHYHSIWRDHTRDYGGNFYSVR